MPVIHLDRLPLPNLKAYTCVSVLALSACIYFASQIINDPNTIINENVPNTLIKEPTHSAINKTDSSNLNGRSLGVWVSQIFSVMTREPVCVWTMINMAFCWLILLGRGIQKLIFGELRVSEQQHLKDKFWNFIFYKFIFIFGVINVQYIDEVLLWCSWFAVLGFINLLCQLSKDRFEYLSFSPTTPLFTHIKLLILLGCIFTTSISLLLIALFVGFFGGFNTFAFMSAEVILVSVNSLHIILRYILHLYDMKQEEKRGPIAYYVELGFELSALFIDFIHHIHMLLWSNIFLSMASLVICMQLRYLFYEIQRRCKKHKNYLWAKNHLEQNYPMASSEELTENSDNCAICWEKMDSARKLPCTHLFHNTCLQSWLEQDTSCPTCRMPLNTTTPRFDPPELQNNNPQPVQRHLNHFFHFDGSRYVSWLPSFSVEVSHAQLLGSPFNRNAAPNSQLDAMGRQVQQLFPHIPLSIIIDDLRVTRSVELTIENVLDGRLVAPAMFRDPDVRQISPPTLMSESSPSTISSIPRSWDDVPTVDTDDTVSLGSRFSKSSSERERILRLRKEQMIQKARKRYIEKRKSSSRSADADDS